MQWPSDIGLRKREGAQLVLYMPRGEAGWGGGGPGVSLLRCPLIAAARLAPPPPPPYPEDQTYLSPIILLLGPELRVAASPAPRCTLRLHIPYGVINLAQLHLLQLRSRMGTARPQASRTMRAKVAVVVVVGDLGTRTGQIILAGMR